MRSDQIEALQAPLNKKNVKSRRQAGTNLSYIEAWHAISEANRIFGHDAWWREILRLEKVMDEVYTNDKGKELCRVGYIATVQITVLDYANDPTDPQTIVRQGTGYGSGIGGTAGDAHEGAVKEAESDAMKRALMTFGNPFGLALYDKDQENVATDAEIAASNEAADAVMTAGQLLMELEEKDLSPERKEEIKQQVKPLWKHINDASKERFKTLLTS